MTDGGPHPRVWYLVGDKAGDNAQVVRIARMVSPEAEEKRLAYNRLRMLPNWLLGGTLVTLAEGYRERIAPPWPDVVVAAGQRTAPVARAIKRASGGTARLIQVGRPRAPLSWFDLVITTPQYRLPQKPNVLRLGLPASTADPAEIDSAVAAWRGRLASSPAPRVALLVGGDVAPYHFDEAAVDRLATETVALCRKSGARLLVTCGRRLGPKAVDRLRAGVAEVCDLFHVFDGDQTTNPYRAYLGLASEFVVTSDSVSMMADAVASGRPLHLFRPSVGGLQWWGVRVLDVAGAALCALLPRSIPDGLVAAGLIIPPRRTDLVSTGLVSAGRAVWLGRQAEAPVRSAAQASEASSIMERMARLLTPGEGQVAGQEG